MPEVSLLSPDLDDLALIDRETGLLQALRAAISSAASASPQRESIRVRLKQLRDQTAGASDDDLAALLDQMHVLQSQARNVVAAALPNPEAPYFGHMQIVRQDGKRRHVLLGTTSFAVASESATVVDWRAAPLARIFFDCEPGEEFEEELPGRTLEGTLLSSCLVAIRHGELAIIDREQRRLARNEHGDWVVRPTPPAPVLGAQPVLRLDGTVLEDGDALVWPPDVSALLDDTQRRTIDADDNRPLLVLGGAGSGKTTVAVHRVEALCRRDPVRYAPGKLLFVVAEKGLARLTRLMLQRLGYEAVEVRSFDAWVARQSAQVFGDLPERTSRTAPAQVVQFKRHAALWRALPDLVQEFGRDLVGAIDRAFVTKGRLTKRFEKTPGATLGERLDKLEKAYCKGMSEDDRRVVHSAFVAQKKRMSKSREWRGMLWGNPAFLRRVAAQSAGQLSERHVLALLERGRLQLSLPTEATLADVDVERLQTLDGRTLDDGTPYEDVQTIDPEDHAVLLECLRLARGEAKTPRGRMSRYAHVVIDEAQELAPVELAALGSSLEPGASTTVAGDRAQQTDPSSCFTGWKDSLAALGVTDYNAAMLETSYRCTAQVTAYAHEVLGPDKPETMPKTISRGPEVHQGSYQLEGQTAWYVVRALRSLLARHPNARIAVVTRDAATAKRTGEVITRSLPARVVLDGSFNFRPGIDVTTVAQVKGLEFDYVIVPDGGSRRYPNTPLARRLMHVAATRAIRELWVIETEDLLP